ARLRADLDDLEIELLAGFERPDVLERPGGRAGEASVVASAPVENLRVVAEPLDVFAELDERAESRQARNLTLHDLADLVLLEPIAPDVVDLLHAERHAAVLRVDFQHLRRHRLALLEHLVGILDALGPTDVADMDEAVKAVLDFDKRAELHNVPHFSGHDGADGVFLRRLEPRIGLRLLHDERNAPVAGFDVQHHDVHFVADLRDLRRMLQLFRPAHFGDVHQAFDALFELDEGAVIHDAHDLALVLSS